MLNTLHYEVSILNSILLSFLSGLLTLSFLKHDESWIKIFTNKTYFYSLLIFLIVPFIISFVSTIFCQDCPISDGIYFYLIITVPSVLIGSTVGLFASFITTKYKFMMFVFTWLVLLFSFLPELYYNPQIYFYNPIFAYFPGVMYDLHIEITKELLLYRFFNILFSFIVLVLILKFDKKSQSRKIIVTTFVVFFYLAFSFIKVSLEFSTDVDRIKNELTNKIVTEHFEIFLPSNISKREIELVKINHEFYYNELNQVLGAEPKNKITSFLFETGVQKKKLFGSQNADVAKLWSNQIYLNYSRYENSLKHEMAHIFSAEFANGIFKMPAMYNPGILEGYAMALENNYDDFDIDYLAAHALINNYKITIKNLFSNFSFFAQTSSISYIYAGSFIKYIANNYGWGKVNSLYSNLDFEKELNKNLLELETEYYEYLETLNIDRNKHVANLYFGRVPLVKKYCARATAKELKNSWEHVKQKKYFMALEQFEEIYKYSNSYSALHGIITCNNFAGAYDKNIELIIDKIPSFNNSSYYYNLELLLTDALIMKNENQLANKNLDSLKIQNPRSDYYNASIIRKILLDKNDSSAIRYITKRDKRKNIISNLLNENSKDEIIQNYLNFIDEENYLDESKRIIELCNNNKYSSDTYFQLSKFAFNNLDFNNAKKYAKSAIKNINFEREEIVKEHLRKIEWCLSNN